MKAPLSNNDEL